MKELNLKVGQKVWSIQLGDCEVNKVVKENDYCFLCVNKKGRVLSYTIHGLYCKSNFHPSLFESNPFEPQKQSIKDKAELINALCNVKANYNGDAIRQMVFDKLMKILESL